MKVTDEVYFGCTVTKIEGEEHNTYVIQHQLSRRKLYTCQEVSAYSIAKLLELEYQVCNWYGKEV